MFGMGTTDDIVIKISSDIKDALVGIRKVDIAIDNMDTNIGKSAARIRNATGKIVKSFALVGVAAGAMTALLGYGMVKQAGNMESYMSTLEQLTGSQEAAAAKMKWLLDFAKKTPFELPGLIEATIKLGAYGIEAEDVLQTIGDTAAIMGKPVNQAVEALADAQTGEFERMKEFGIKAIVISEQNAAKLGATTEQIGKTALTYVDKYKKEQSAIIDRNNREQVTSTIQAIWNEKYAGGMAKQSMTLKGMVSNIKDAMGQGSDAIMGFEVATGKFRPDSLFAKVKGAVDNILGYIDNIDFNAVAAKVEAAVNSIIAFISRLYTELEPTINNLKSIFESVVGIVKDVSDSFASSESGAVSMTEAINALTGAMAAVFRWVDKHPAITKLAVTLGLAAVAFAFILPIVTGVAGAISSLSIFIGSLATAIGGATSVIGAITAVIAVLGGPITVVIAAVALLAAAWATNFLGIRDITHNVFTWIEDRFYDLVNFIGPLLALYVNGWIKAFNFLVPYLNKAGFNLSTVAELQFTKLEKTIADTASSIETSTEDISGAMKQVETDIEATTTDAAASYQDFGNAIASTAEKLTMSMVEAGVTQADLDKRASDIASGVIRPAAGAVKSISAQRDNEPAVRMVSEQMETNKKLDKLDKLDSLDVLSDISSKLDRLKLEINNYVTNNYKNGGSSDRSGGLVDNTKKAAEINTNLPTYTVALPSWASLF